MKKAVRFFSIVACSSLSVLVGACSGASDGGSTSTNSTTTPSDNGSSRDDAGGSGDGETSTSDAGTRGDTGHAGDAGTHSDAAHDSDAAPTSSDTGAPSSADAGTTSDSRATIDSAPIAIDTGISVDSAIAPDTAPGIDTAAPPPTVGSGLLIAYDATWTRGILPPSAIAWDHLTHVAHAFVLPAAGGGLTGVSTYVDSELITTAHAHGVKVVASVGGAGANFDGNTDPAARAATVAAMADLCATYGYDGIDIDWEFPTATTGPAWASLISELRVALDKVRPGLTISAATANGPFHGDNLPTDGLKALDWVGVMTYDYAGSWSGTSGHESPLYPTAGGDGGSVSDSMQYFVSTRGIPANRVMVGLAFYGVEFGASALNSTPVAPALNPDYRDIVPMIGTASWTSNWDATAHVPFLQRAMNPGFLSYEDPRSIGDKCAYAKTQKLGGAILWHLAATRLSDGTDPLLDAAQPCR